MFSKTLLWILAFSFEGLLLVCIVYQWRFATIDLVFVSKILVFEIESDSKLQKWTSILGICARYLQIHENTEYL